VVRLDAGRMPTGGQKGAQEPPDKKKEPAPAGEGEGASSGNVEEPAIGERRLNGLPVKGAVGEAQDQDSPTRKMHDDFEQPHGGFRSSVARGRTKVPDVQPASVEGGGLLHTVQPSSVMGMHTCSQELAGGAPRPRLQQRVILQDITGRKSAVTCSKKTKRRRATQSEEKNVKR